MNLIDTILSRNEFSEQPPVLVDIGASGALHQEWNSIAKYSICVAFDPDDREMGFSSKLSNSFKKLYIIPSIVTDREINETLFHLTKSPYCSSLLEPDQQSLDDWAFSELFQVTGTVVLKSTTLSSALHELNLQGIDWFKTDSQGIDLRLFKSLQPDVMNHLIVADFEPGFIDAYRGEDKLFSLLAFMEGSDFWMSDLRIFGSQRIRKEIRDVNFTPLIGKFFRYLVKTSPGWGEVSFLNSLRQDQLFSERDYLLAWVFSTIKKQHGFACEIALKGLNRFDEPLFAEMRDHSLSKIRKAIFILPLAYCKRIIDKLFTIAGVDTL